jgi:DNA-binding response OmpR family regulator
MRKVLLVSDDPSLRDGVREALAGGGCALRCAPDGRRGAAMLVEEPADLIITDWTATADDSIESLKRLRFEYHNARRLAVVEGGTLADVIDALRWHVCDFLTKPFTHDELRVAVRNALDGCPAARVEVVSAHPGWVELLAPGDLAAISPLQKLLAQLDADLPREVHEAFSYAFREMLSNAVEYGCRLDPAQCGKRAACARAASASC